jgi:hypothetical protein
MSEDHDVWLYDLERRARRLPPRPAEPEPEPAKPPIPDADQGHRGPRLDVRRSPSKDAFLMAVRAAAKDEPHEDEWYAD